MASAQVPQRTFQGSYSRDFEGQMDVGRLGESAEAGSSSMLEPAGHHHYIRGRSADDLNNERVSSVEVCSFILLLLPYISYKGSTHSRVGRTPISDLSKHAEMNLAGSLS